MSNKPKPKYGLFDEFVLAVVGACEVAKTRQISLYRANKHIYKRNRHFDGTLNHFGPMVSAENKNKMNPTHLRRFFYNQKIRGFILSIIKEVKACVARSHRKLTKKSEVNNKHKNKDGNIKTILLNLFFKRKRFKYRILMKHKSRLCSYGLIQELGFNYWENYSSVVNWIGGSSV